MIRAEDVEFWQVQANKKAADFPHVGRKVTVVDGRKHKGKTGVVLVHREDRFSDAFRYGGDANFTMRQMAGRYGYVVLVDTGTERFWVKASYCLCEGRTSTPEQNYTKFCEQTESKAKEIGRRLTQDEEQLLWQEIHK